MKKKTEFAYKRTPAPEGAGIEVEFSNGERWFIPAQVIADDRDANYADEEEDIIGFIISGGLGSYDLIDWCSNNMNFSDVLLHAKKLPPKVLTLDYEDEWGNCEKKVVGFDK